MNRLLGSEHPKLSSNVSNFFSQSIQQEIYFFVLPFLFAATQWEAPGQVAFTGIIVLTALISTVDPWYDKYIYKNRLASLAFHALCCFVSALVILPIVVKLPTEQTLIVVMGFLVVWLLLAMPNLLTRLPDWKSRGLASLGLCAIPACIWLFRASIPAAGLLATNGVISTGVINHEPTNVVSSIAASSLADGVYAYVVIKAPRGLAQEIGFRWHHGNYSETIAAEITGGRDEGYRIYSVKSNFPDPAEGAWTVDVRTAQGQLLRHLEFVVAGTDSASNAEARLEATTAQEPAVKLEV